MLVLSADPSLPGSPLDPPARPGDHAAWLGAFQGRGGQGWPTRSDGGGRRAAAQSLQLGAISAIMYRRHAGNAACLPRSRLLPVPCPSLACSPRRCGRRWRPLSASRSTSWARRCRALHGSLNPRWVAPSGRPSCDPCMLPPLFRSTSRRLAPHRSCVALSPCCLRRAAGCCARSCLAAQAMAGAYCRACCTALAAAPLVCPQPHTPSLPAAFALSTSRAHIHARNSPHHLTNTDASRWPTPADHTPLPPAGRRPPLGASPGPL